VKTVTDKCGVLVTWDAPKSSCQPISNYFFQVRDDQSTKFTDVDREICGGESNVNSCLIPMAVLIQAPYFIDEGANIETRGKACNEKGCATEWPASQNPAGYGNFISTRPLQKPVQMTQPTVSEKVRHLTVSWDRLVDASYEVFW
jgi:hypothetical protein